MTSQINRGEVYFADLDPVTGSEQGGFRPVLIIQNDIGNKHSPTTVIAAITSKPKIKSTMPTHYPISRDSGLEKDSVVLLEQLRTIDKTRLSKYVCTLNKETMKGIDHAISVGLGFNYACKK